MKQLVLLQRQTVHVGIQQTSQKRDKFSTKNKNCGVSETELNMKVTTMVEEWVACRGSENR